jgi:omega-6 fatty acid desaturase (delta-12 desaturase)
MCHEDKQNNFDDVKRLELHQLRECFSLILWDHEALRLVSTPK